MLVLLANLGYLLQLCAFVTRDVLYLRGFLVVAQAIVIFYTWRNGVYLISAWNALFVTINSFMVVQILRERKAVQLPPDLLALHEQHFAALSPPEFLRWWRMGKRETLDDQKLVAAGTYPDWLYFILDGTVRVHRPGGDVVLPAGYLVGEMSLITGQPANADAEALGRTDVMKWSTRDLRELREKKPALWARIQSVIGHDLVEKIQRSENVAPSTAAS